MHEMMLRDTPLRGAVYRNPVVPCISAVSQSPARPFGLGSNPSRLESLARAMEKGFVP